jgi:hypothetical protein
MRSIDRLFLAGKNLELAAQVARDLNEPLEAVSLYGRAKQYYEVKGMNDKAAEALQKAAKCVPNPFLRDVLICLCCAV